MLGTGVADAGTSVRDGFRSAASAAANIPLAGGDLAGALRSAGSATGGNVAAVGHAGEVGAHRLGTVLGLLMWGLPTLLLLLLVLPRRIREVREVRYLRRTLRGPGSDARQRLLAFRALTSLPEDVLFAHSPDPAGDLLAGRYGPLSAAALEAGGVRAEPRAEAPSPRGEAPSPRGGTPGGGAPTPPPAEPPSPPAEPPSPPG